MTNEAEPRTKTGREAVRLRGLFAGETWVRASAWVRKIEDEALSEAQKEITRLEYALERSAGAAPRADDELADPGKPERKGWL